MARRSFGLLLALVAVATFARPTLAVDALIDSLLVLRDDHRPDRVESLAGPAIEAARADGDSTRLLHLLLIRGATRAGFGHARRAETDLREAGALATARVDTLRRLQCIRWLSVAVGRQGRGVEAAQLYDELEAMAAVARDSIHLGWAWVGQAYDHHLQGRPAAAGTTYARAAGVLERYGQVEGAVWAWNGRGLALRQAGRYREARDAFAHVLALAEASGDVINEATSLNYLGRLDMQLGDPGRAVRLFERSAAIHRASQHHREGLVPCIDIATARIMQGRYDEAEAGLDSVLAVCRELGLRDLEILAGNHLVDAWLAQGRPGAAASRCREELAGGEMPSRLSATEIRLRLARSLANQDSLVAATEVLEQALLEGTGSVALELRTTGLLGALLVDLDRPDEAAQVLRPTLAVAREAGADAERVVLLTHLGRAEAALERPDSALAAYGRAIACWERVRTWPSDPAWREHRGTASGSLFAQAVAARLGEPGGLADAWSWAQRHKARTLQERMLGPDTPGVVVEPPELGTFQLRVLDPGEVFLDVVEGERLTVLFCVTRDTALAAVLAGRRETAARLRRLADIVTSHAIDDPGPAMELAAGVVAPWPAEVRRLTEGAQAVAWCPDGAWHRFPAALMGWDGALTRVPAAGVLASLKDPSFVTTSSLPSSAKVLAICGPDPLGPGPLPGARRETDWLSTHLHGVERVGGAGDLDQNAWASADVLHLAAHTRLDTRQPWRTSITLARGEGGSLTAADVLGLDLGARLTVLAGCTTVGTRLVGGEGLIGLAGAFLAVRTPAVLATLWPVDDAIALQVMTVFYEALAEGATAASALDRARRGCAADPVGRAPRHWAGFVLVGDGDVTVPIRRRAPRWPWALGLAGLAVVVFVRSRR